MNWKRTMQLIFIIIACQCFVAASLGQTNHNKAKQIKVESKSNYQQNQVASFPGGTDSLYKYLKSNIHYTAQAKEDEAQGQVVLTFLVSETGIIEDIRILRDIGMGCGKEAVRVVKTMPKWKPYKVHGVAKKMLYVLPVQFKMDD